MTQTNAQTQEQAIDRVPGTMDEAREMVEEAAANSCDINRLFLAYLILKKGRQLTA